MGNRGKPETAPAKSRPLGGPGDGLRELFDRLLEIEPLCVDTLKGVLEKKHPFEGVLEKNHPDLLGVFFREQLGSRKFSFFQLFSKKNTQNLNLNQIKFTHLFRNFSLLFEHRNLEIVDVYPPSLTKF